MPKRFFCSTAKVARGDKTALQVRTIFALAKSRDLNDDELRSIVEEETGSRSISGLSRSDALKVINRLNGTSAPPARRTVQHRRRQAGVPQIASPAHLDLMRSLARRRGMGDEGLEQLSIRQCGHYPPRTTSETNSVVEALKAMNKREAVWA
ncbi:MAG: phage protein GemA/Gp16 family protein [Pyrinomonadaceae bacterium]